jgi:hypothetical protein
METQHEILKTDNTPATRLLLSSLADFWSLIEPMLAAATPKTICEIGIGQGEFARLLLNFCAERRCRYTGIDTLFDEQVEHFQNAAEAQAEFFREPSLTVLARLPSQDVYFVDGDHNYYTVLEELRSIRKPDHSPLIFLHDVCWPWGRRDHYCAPDSIPEKCRHPYSTSLGVVPGRNELEPGGFSGETSAYNYGAAVHEGGPRNGVLTAVEDFLKEQTTEEWKFVIVPAVFGLGILYAPDRCPSPVAEQIVRLEASVAPLKPLLELLESNRVNLFLDHLTKLHQLGNIHGHYSRLKEAYEKLNVHSTGLLSNYNTLLQHNHALQAAYEDLVRVAFGSTGFQPFRP